MTRHGIGAHAAGERLPRHRHAEGYIAVVLDGGFEEAGDDGRFTARAGMVVVHGLYEAHQDRFEARGARVLNLPGIPGLAPGAGSIADSDAVARLAERDPLAAAHLVRETFIPGARQAADWPDLLAEALRTDPDLALGPWADAMRLDPASVSRGFARAYGVSPKRFRLEARTRRAVLALTQWHGSLAIFAADQGFADQAHLTRSITALTGHTPGKVRSIR
ncbi:helix-turn-helix domain-containing protein [Sphingomonas sp. LB-2]|uniref:AraC family transcriptional regulator n=1 Tax=Sphingomonas caeni TaxID=2984949 RepID=UPI00222EA662|nr:helix-turn-helix domain-containing protein [Sphingomonas caeni]MCW3846049.1 helix-turn-helix domain-containing protein [Sphingomonas caeni]